MDKTTTKINQALAIANQGNYAEAIKRFHKILKQEPNNPIAIYALGATHYLARNYEVALELLERSNQLLPNNVDTLSILSVSHAKAGSIVKGLNYVQQALKLAPKHINSLLSAGDIYSALRDFAKAEQAFLEVLKQKPDDYTANTNLGVLYGTQGRRSESTDCFEKAYLKDPQDPIAVANYISGLYITDRGEELSELFPKAMKQPYFGVGVFTVLTISRYLCAWQQTERLLDEMKKMLLLPLREILYEVYMQINMVSLSIPELDNDLIFQLHRRAGQTAAAQRIAPPYTEHPNAWANTKKWRIGYLSADFRGHSVSTFLRALVNEHDRDRFEVYCYSNTVTPDERTEEYKRVADAFIDVTHLNDHQLAERIHADGIHFLVDLSGYTLDSRQSVMAYQPAPLQIIYMGYPYTTGLAEVDYMISDPYLDVPDNARYFTERQLQLPECFLSFGKMDVQPITAAPPCQRNGYISFGSLNNIYKLNPKVIATWAEILASVPTSRMIINHPKLKAPISRQAIIDEFSRQGIGADRLQLIWERHPAGSHFNYYNDIDIALDTFPLVGGTTTTDAIWMGVPVITLVGDLYHKRISYSIINNIGLDKAETASWCATTTEEYIAKAIALANDPERIARLRQLIPEKLKTSILTDEVRLVRHIEEAYLRAWSLKFQEVPVDTDISPDEMAAHPLGHNGLELFTYNRAEDLTYYVLQEREGGWFEAEWEYLPKLTTATDQILIIGAGAGIYALPLGQKAQAGKILCVCRTPTDAHLLQRSIAHNHLSQIRIINNGQHKFQLDHESSLSGARIDLLILHGRYATPGIFENGEAFFEAQDPLIMFAVHNDQEDMNQVDRSLIEAFVAHGYHILRMIPVLDCLVPVEDINEIDALCLNLFACKNSRAERLLDAGFLTLPEEPLKTLPGLDVRDWQDLFIRQGFAAQLPGWIDRPDKPENWEVYWVALHLYARSLDKALPLGVRCNNLKTASNIMAMLNTTHATPWRLASQSVIYEALGWREKAVRALDIVCAALIQAPALELAEPCLLLVDPLIDETPPHPEQTQSWLLRQAVAQRERLRSHSSFFNGSKDLPLLDELESLVGLPQDLARRRQLIRQRCHP